MGIGFPLLPLSYSNPSQLHKLHSQPSNIEGMNHCIMRTSRIAVNWPLTISMAHSHAVRVCYGKCAQSVWVSNRRHCQVLTLFWRVSDTASWGGASWGGGAIPSALGVRAARAKYAPASEPERSVIQIEHFERAVTSIVNSFVLPPIKQHQPTANDKTN